tara:strand:+ start:73 stop:516 length:444 start_codon:yes stop_codon:yes gene_type:complete
MYYYEHTDFPNIYQHVYWGRFANDIKKYDITSKIIHARNWFILHYKIISYKSCPDNLCGLRQELRLDHTETYEDELGRIVYIYSMNDLRDVIGFTNIPSMYALDQQTGVRIIETRKSKRKMIQYIKSKVPDDIIPIIKSYLGKGHYM